ncbi:MAG: carbohydrate ABC transporter permease, partial [Oscillospiraceae bacterium]|nr:carbohydrate ABC transporter permease [Oscillospiraceae bacterium]
QSLSVDIQEMLQSGKTSQSLANITELSNRNLNAAKIVVAVIPLLMIYPFLQKYLITGIVVGSVKE